MVRRIRGEARLRDQERRFDMPLSVAVSGIEMLESVAVLDKTSRKLVQKLMPGPITLIITKKPNVPDIVTSGSMRSGSECQIILWPYR